MKGRKEREEKGEKKGWELREKMEEKIGREEIARYKFGEKGAVVGKIKYNK